MIRAVPSNASDNVYCTLLAQSCVHGAMAGYTGYTSGLVNGRQTYIPFNVSCSVFTCLAFFWNLGCLFGGRDLENFHAYLLESYFWGLAASDNNYFAKLPALSKGMCKARLEVLRVNDMRISAIIIISSALIF